MKNSRIISPSDVRLYYFSSKDVLLSNDEKENRRKKLQRAVAMTHNVRVPISIYLKLPSGETLETHSDSFAFADDFVIIKGGFVIPLGAILDVDA
ncbi:MAG TPA: hypothetical protein VFV79_01145 [Saprospiraceae bacterium]|nr:hypothetical protein [Saprospiraceae bacterium]